MSKLLSNEEVLEVRREQITSLVKSYYSKLDFLKYEPLNLLIDKALELFLESDLTMDEINEKIIEAIASRKKSLNDRYDSEKVKENHETIYGKLELLARELHKEGIDYQLAGSLCGYIQYDEESDRTHDDIDINLNEADMEKFHKVCSKLGLYFEDNRMSSPRVLKNGIPSGEHEVIAKDSNSDFHIGVFPFERLEDGSVISKGYYHDEDGSPCVREEIFTPEAACMVFGEEEVDFRGTPITITPVEYVFLLKEYTKNEKDLHDISFFNNKIDKTRLARLREVLRNGKVVQNVPVNGFPSESITNSFNEDEDDLGLMLADDNPFSKDDDQSKKKEGEKVFIKRQQQQQQSQEQQFSNSEEGFISNTIITTLTLITFVLCAIGIAVIYLAQM